MQGIGNWDDLRFFLGVARNGGLSAASRELGVNQSTVSRRVAQLEEALSARLFDRQPRGYALTPVGEDMLARVEAIEDDVLALNRLVQGADRELRGTVRVTTVDEVFERIAPHIRAFRDRYPGIHLEVSSDLRMYSLSRREADVAVRPGGAPTEGDVVGRKLAVLSLAAYASSAYLRGRKRPRRVADLSAHDLIGFQEDRPGAQLLDDAKLRQQVVLRANSMTGQAIAARAGLGIAILPTFMGDPDAGLERLFVVPPTRAAHLWLLVHADLRQTARVRAFVDFLTDAISNERALYEGSG